MERSRLMQSRTLALRRQDYDEVKEIDAELENLANTNDSKPHEEVADMLAKVNERNRKANMEAVRKAELMESERRRRDRKLAAAGALPPQDPSARLKTIPRLFNSATPSRFVFIHSSPLFSPLCFTASGQEPLFQEEPLYYKPNQVEVLYPHYRSQPFPELITKSHLNLL